MLDYTVAQFNERQAAPSPEKYEQSLQPVMNRRGAQLGLAPLFGMVETPFPWIPDVIELKQEKNFFETQVIAYQNGGRLARE